MPGFNGLTCGKLFIDYNFGTDYRAASKFGKHIQRNLYLRTPLHCGQFVWSHKCQKSYVPYLYNTDTSVVRTIGSVPLVSVLKRFDSRAHRP